MSHSRIITITSVIVGTAVIASTLYAQALTISSTIENLTIQARKIFVSDDAKKMYDSSITFDGSNGNIKTASLTLSDDQYSCPDRSGTGCALAVNRDGSVVRKDVTLQGSTTTTTTDPSDSEDYFVSKGGSADRLNRTANEIVFADPSLVSDTDQARLRINIKDVVNTNTTVAGANKMLDVGGAINSRTSLEVSSPLDRSDQTAYNLQGKARGDLIITKHVQHPMPPAATIKVGYNNGTAYTRQDLIVSPPVDVAIDSATPQLGCLKANPGAYHSIGTRIYKTGFGIHDVSNPDNTLNSIEMFFTDHIWQRNIRNQGRINSLSVWAYESCTNGTPLSTINTSITLPYIYYNNGASTKQLYLGVFGDANFVVKINGVDIAKTLPYNYTYNSAGQINGVQSSSSHLIHQKVYHILPITMVPGRNSINVTTISDGYVEDGMGYEIYDNTATQIRNAITSGDLNIIFSTENMKEKMISINEVCGPGETLEPVDGDIMNMRCTIISNNTNRDGVQARLGINTPTYPTATLDVNGEMRSQETLTIGYLNSGNIVTNIRQAVGILISSPSATEQTAIRSQSCGDSPIPSSLQCSNGSCSSLLLSGSEIGSSICYDRVGTSTTMQRAQMYQVMSLYSSTTLIAKTDTQQVGINTLVPQSTLDVNGDTYLDGSGYIFGIPASTSNGKTSIQMKEINNTESTTYTGGNTNCKGLSVDEAGHIILVQLPKTMCGATGSIVTPPTLATNGACGSAHNTTGTSAPTSNLCSAGTASSVAGSGPWTWSCAGSNGGTSASCQMNKQGILTRIYNCDNKPDHTIWNTVSNYTQTSNNGGTTWTPTNTFTTYNETGSTTSCRFTCDEGYERDGVSCILDPQYCIETNDRGVCFIQDTLVTLADGSMKKIQDIVVGDILKGVSTNNTVLSLLRPQLGNKLLYSINGSDAFVTPNHPFLTTQGWKSIDPDTTRREIASLSVSLLKIGDTLITESGNIIVTSLIPHTADASTQLYNFELDGDHTYFANGLAVHNKNDVESCMAAIYDNNGNDILQYCAGYSYAAPTTNHPNRRIFPNLVNPSQPGALCTTSRDCGGTSLRCDRDLHLCGSDVIPISNVCEAYCENNPNYTGPIGTPACSGLNAAMCNNNTPRCQWTDPTLL